MNFNSSETFTFFAIVSAFHSANLVKELFWNYDLCNSVQGFGFLGQKMKGAWTLSLASGFYCWLIPCFMATEVQRRSYPPLGFLGLFRDYLRACFCFVINCVWDHLDILLYSVPQDWYIFFIYYIVPALWQALSMYIFAITLLYKYMSLEQGDIKSFFLANWLLHLGGKPPSRYLFELVFELLDLCLVKFLIL